MKGYAINKNIQIERYKELKEVVRLMTRGGPYTDDCRESHRIKGRDGGK